MSATLYLIPSPLATDTLDYLPPVVSNTIKELDLFFVEEIRTCRRFVSSLKLGLVIEDLQFELLDKSTPEWALKKFIDLLKGGRSAGIISEAGCPGIADPGAKLVALAHQHGIKVKPLPGPTSMFLGLMATGFNGQSFTFHGYLPIDKEDRGKKIKEIERVALQTGISQFFMETPFRNNQLFKSILENCQNDTLLSIATNLTAPEESVLTLPVRLWKKKEIDLHKQPSVFYLSAK
jgi:16S rRNA (cytidine1402-2'-O)-methyltransferase